MRILLLAALVVSLAGCTEPQTAAVVTIIDDSGEAHTTVTFDPAAYPTADDYVANGKQHPDFYSVHDLMVDWSKTTATDVEFEFFDSSFGWGFFLKSIDGVPGEGENKFWSLSINGESSTVGASEAPARNGDQVTWTLKAF